MHDENMTDMCHEQNMTRDVTRNTTDNRGDVVWDIEETELDTNLEGNESGGGGRLMFVVHLVTKYIFLE